MKDTYPILVITEEGYDAGFRLAGCRACVTQNKEEIISIVDDAIEKKNYGIILIEETLFQQLDQKHREKCIKSALPLVVSLPLRRKEHVSPHDYLREMVRRTLGYTIRIKE